MLLRECPDSPSYRDPMGDFLVGHEINEDNRARMMDWMLQVFRVLKVST